MSFNITFLALSAAIAVGASWSPAVQAQAPMPTLAGAPAAATAFAPGPTDAPADAGHAKECYAKVKFGAQYAEAPPTGPQFRWRQEPGPPGAPGPIWCLVPEVSAPHQVLISPERYGWIRVLCDTEATPARIVGVQRQLSAAGVYQGPIDGRYDQNTTAAVQRFQAARHIEDRGYLSYATLSALSGFTQRPPAEREPQSRYAPNANEQPPYPYPYPQTAYPPPYAYGYGQRPPWSDSYRPLTTFDTGVLTWPGKR
jgi:hypothetical protein